MSITNQQRVLNYEDLNTPFVLKELFDGFSYKIIMSVVEEPKSVFQICKENDLPVSSTYKKIKKLKELDLLVVDRIIISEKGKRILFYKSKVQSVELLLDKKNIILQFRKNDKNLR